MDYRIVEKPAFTIIGKPLRVATKEGENFRQIPAFWDESFANGLHDQLEALASQNVLPDVTLGVCTDFAPDMSEFTYLIAVESGSETAPDGLVAQSVPALTWAVFETVGPMPDAIQTIWDRIWAEFFPSAAYKYADGPSLELYPAGDPSQPGYTAAVWVPVTAA